MRNIIAQEIAINKFISENGEKSFDFLTSVPRKHICSMLLSFAERGNSGKTADFAEYTILIVLFPFIFCQRESAMNTVWIRRRNAKFSARWKHKL